MQETFIPIQSDLLNLFLVCFYWICFLYVIYKLSWVIVSNEINAFDMLRNVNNKDNQPWRKKEEKMTLGVYIYLIHNPMLSCSYVLPFGYYWLLNKERNKQTNLQVVAKNLERSRIWVMGWVLEKTTTRCAVSRRRRKRSWEKRNSDVPDISHFTFSLGLRSQHAWRDEVHFSHWHRLHARSWLPGSREPMV